MIDKLYNELLPIVLNDIDENYIDDLKEGLKNYLSERYKNSFNDPKTSEINYNNFLKIEKNRWTNTPNINKLSYLIYDENFEKLIQLSNNIFLLAKDKMYNKYKIDRNLSNEEIQKTISNIEYLADNVYFFNSHNVKNLLSETILDYLYVYTNNDDMSLRLGKEYNNYKYLNELKKKINN